MNQPNDRTWVIFCTGSSITGKIDKLNEYFKNWENSIAVNNAILYFPSSYWLFLDYRTYDPSKNKNSKIITSHQTCAAVQRDYKDFVAYERMSPTSNSGVSAVKFAIEQGAKVIITCGLDLKDNWEYFYPCSDRYTSKAYISLIRNEFRRLIKSKGKNCRILSVDPNNILGLEFYDIEGVNL